MNLSFIFLGKEHYGKMQVNRIFVEKFNVLQDELEFCECGGRDKMI